MTPLTETIIAARERAMDADLVTPDDLRILAVVRSRIRLDPSTGCWDWHGANGGCGRAMISLTRGKKTHIKPRIWADIHGALPPGTRIIRLCGNGDCVSPNAGHMTPCSANEKRGQTRPGTGDSISWSQVSRMDAIDRIRRREALEREGYPTSLMVR